MKLVFLVYAICLVVILMFVSRKDNFEPSTAGMYHSGNVWGDWNGNPIPWNNCIDPNNPGECSPYCQKKLTRQPDNRFKAECYPVCGTPCLTGADCPAGCQNCKNGICVPN